jgi:exopolyphosphatase/guanosine-5'-triphosphate,3'-diphosphate pyrophosphatase
MDKKLLIKLYGSGLNRAKMRRIGIIDLGTNTFNLLLAEVKEQHYTIFYKTKIAVKLGEGGITKGTIAQAPYQRGIDALTKYKAILVEKNITEFYAVATSAIRSANNGVFFAQEVEDKLGIKINIIDGDTEADLIYHGVKQAIDLESSPKLIIDIGGGSTEFIIANSEEIFWRKSYKLGAARLLETFNPANPINIENIATIDAYLEETLEEMLEMAEIYEVNCLIGSSGSFDTLAEMISCKNGSCDLWKKETQYQFLMTDYNGIQRTISESTLEQRLQMEGLIPMRADMIVIAVVIINYILNRLIIHDLRLSSYALKEGLIDTLLTKPHTWQKSSL